VKKVEEIETDTLIREFDRRLERLRILYEQYFIGVAKRAPIIELKNVVRLKHELDRASLRNAAEKFRYNNLRQKFSSQRAYWDRTMRAIESGTYRRRRGGGAPAKQILRKKRNRRATLKEDGMPASVSEDNLMISTDLPAGPANIRRPPSLAMGAVVQDPGEGKLVKPRSALGQAKRTEKNELDVVYRKMSQDYRSCGKKAPAYDKVIHKLQSQIEKARKLHPGKKVRVESYVKNGRPTIAIKVK